MLIRFIAKNVFSFKEQTEFNALPNRGTRLKEHKYSRKGIDILKMAALYGANGSGKSNFIKAISLLKSIAIDKEVPKGIDSKKFKLLANNQEPIDFAIEFFTNNDIYFYSVSVKGGEIVEEYLSKFIDRQSEQIVFHRYESGENVELRFFDDFYIKSENEVLKTVIVKDLLKRDQSALYLLNSITNDDFKDIKLAFDWIANNLIIILPNSSANALAHEIDIDNELSAFTNELMCSFYTGIKRINVETKQLKEMFSVGPENGIDMQRIETDLKELDRVGMLVSRSNEQITVINQDGEILAKRFVFEHLGENGEIFPFRITEESDGTRRLLEYMPALNLVINKPFTILIDEIERSLHPLIVKEIISKFSLDSDTKGQLIFSTHESNLLDQDIFRLDEIWFCEKNLLGESKLYSLSDFKEHNTIDIRKGYLNGRYGAIPFLGNLQDLNWNESKA